MRAELGVICRQWLAAPLGMLFVLLAMAPAAAQTPCSPATHVVAPTSCGVGICAEAGQLVCEGGFVVDTCVPGTPNIGRMTFAAGPESAIADVVRGDTFNFAPPVGTTWITWSPDGGVTDGHVSVTAPVSGGAYASSLRAYGLIDQSPPRGRMLGGTVSGYFKTSDGPVKPWSTDPTTARVRWFFAGDVNNTPGNGADDVIWVSKDAHAWNPNGDVDWTQHTIAVTYANFAYWSPFRTAGYVGTVAEFENAARHMDRVGVWFTSSAMIVNTHLHATWSTRSNYALVAQSTTVPATMRWDNVQTTTIASVPDDNCDGVDDDCSGQADEDFVPIPTGATCGVGACLSAAATVCRSGQRVVDCTPGQPQVELCDATDWNCDGSPNDVSDSGSCLECTASMPICDADGEVVWGVMELVGGTLRGFRCVVASPGAAPVCDVVPGTTTLVDYEPVCTP